MPRRTLLAACFTLGALTALPAAAQFQKPEDAVKYRKAAFTLGRLWSEARRYLAGIRLRPQVAAALTDTGRVEARETAA